MQKSQNENKLLKSIFSSFTYVLINSIISLYVLSIVVKDLGLELLGIWSIVNAMTSLGNVVNLGLGNSLPKFVAYYISKKDYEYTSKIIGTALVSTIVFTVILLIAINILFYFNTYTIYNDLYSNVIHEVFFMTLINFGLSNINGVILLSFDGFSKIYIRNIIQISGSILYVILSVILIKEYKLKGLALSQIFQQILIFFVAFYFLIKNNKYFIKNLFYFRVSCFKEMFEYSYKIQIINFISIFSDPLMKILFSKYGGLSLTGYYELSQKIIGTIRSFIVIVNQVIIPEVSKNHDNPESIYALIRINNRVINLVAIIIFSSPFLGLTFLSNYWFKMYNSIFAFTFICVTVGLFINSLAIPFYMYFMGTGNLKWNVLSNTVAAICTAVIGTISGYFYGYQGLLISWIIACISGSLLTFLPFIFETKEKVKSFIKIEDLILFLNCSIVSYTLFTLEEFYHLTFTLPILKVIINGIIFVLLILPSVINHSGFKFIYSYFKNLRNTYNTKVVH